MKQLLKYGLFLLALIGYMTSAMELDAKECNQNYNKETHTYICSKSDTHLVSHLEVANTLPAIILSFLIADKVSQPATIYYSTADPVPPERLYLRYSIFLI